jgi:hypothetical protein
VKTPGQVAYERRNRRCPDAPAWDDLVPCLQRTWECTADAVAQPLGAEIAELQTIVREMALWVPPSAAKAARWHERAGIAKRGDLPVTEAGQVPDASDDPNVCSYHGGPASAGEGNCPVCKSGIDADLAFGDLPDSDPIPATPMHAPQAARVPGQDDTRSDMAAIGGTEAAR